MFDDEPLEYRLSRLWETVRIARPVHYSLFTFGESQLPYYLVCEAVPPERTVTIRRGEVRITRPTIITPDNAGPQFRNFFADADDANAVQLLMARSAAFSHLQFDNTSGPERIVSDSVQEAVDRLNRQLDDEEEDHVAILTAPAELAGLALLKYAADRVWRSAPDNLQELRERGFLP